MELWGKLRSDLIPRLDAFKNRLETHVVSMTPDLDVPFRERCAHIVERVSSYFDPEVRGLSRLPETGPYVLVGNHSGGAYTPDTAIFMAAFLRHWGMEKPIRPLAHDILFSVPSLSEALRRLGVLPASPANAHQALERGDILLVYPGGDYECQRPFFESHLVDFAGRKGFIRMALERRVPVFPVVCHGSNETVITLTRGERLARATFLTRITRSKVLPLRLSFPFGVVPAGVPHVPLPSKITIEVGYRMAWDDFSPEDARNDALVAALYDDIVCTMQRTMNGLYNERPNPFARRKRRVVEPLHSPPPPPPRAALQLRESASCPVASLDEKRARQSTDPPAKSSTSAA